MKTWLTARGALRACNGRRRDSYLPACIVRAHSTGASEEDYVKVRKWYDNLGNAPLPRDIGEVSYSRSSGPGGQNVNKYDPNHVTGLEPRLINAG